MDYLSLLACLVNLIPMNIIVLKEYIIDKILKHHKAKILANFKFIFPQSHGYPLETD